MLGYICDICGKVLSSETNKIDRKENRYIGIINIDFLASEKQYHVCKNCFDKLIKGTKIEYDIVTKEMNKNND